MQKQFLELSSKQQHLYKFSGSQSSADENSLLLGYCALEQVVHTHSDGTQHPRKTEFSPKFALTKMLNIIIKQLKR
jgi:hypothetical protein